MKLQCKNCNCEIEKFENYFLHTQKNRWDGDNGVICRPTNYSQPLTGAAPKSQIQ
jgi:hypothetical protein